MVRSVGKVTSFYRYPPPPFQCWIFQGKNGDFSYLKNSNIEYGGGGPQEHGISQISQPIVRKIELGVK